jgi:hypothetical protein
VADLKTDWSYPVMETTLDKRVERPGVQRGFSSEMTGVDGSSEGGLRPFPGFKLAYTITELQNQTNHTHKSVIVDFKAVDFRIGSEEYAYGFVYRAVRPATPTVSDVFIDYWDSVNQSFTRCVKLMDAAPVTGQFDVQVAGRFVYCFLEGRSPSLFYIEATRTKEYACEVDAFINSAAATTNYESTQPLTLEVISGGTTKNTLLRFDTSAETGKTVESAVLEFTVTGNALTGASGTLFVAPVDDSSLTGVLWNEAQVTWNNRTTSAPWGTPGGTYEAAHQISTTLLKNYLGKVQLTATNIVQRAVSGLSQSFTRKTDVIVRGSTAGNLISFAGRTQPNYGIRPKLTVTYTNKTFLTPTVIGSTGTGTIPGPGMQPSLSSPERGIAPGSFTTLETGRPASAQVVLLAENPYTSSNLFPNEASGICYNDTVPAAGAVSQPGTANSHSATGSACTDGVGILTQLLTPANKQTNVSVTPKLDWTSYYPDGEALNANVRWDVYLVEEGTGALDDHCIATDLAVSNYSPAQLFPNLRLAYGKTYYWKVAVKREDCTGFFYESIVGSFTTENRYQARKFEPGDYSFGYVLVNSKTGRKSAFSTVAQVRSEDFVLARTQGGNNLSVKNDQYVGIEIVYDSSKYDLMYVYRSVKIQDAGGTMVAGLPFLDAVVRLSDYHTCLNGTGRTFGDATTSRHAMYFYELEDKQLVYQDAYVDRSVFDEKMPFGGTALFHQNTMLVSKIDAPPESTTETKRVSDTVRGLGEMRWSSLMDLVPELFPPFNRYTPTVPSNEVVKFGRAGSNAIGLSRDKVYHIRKSGPYIKVTEMHEGYGIVNPRAADSVGSSVYYVTSHGLKSVDAQGQLDEIRNLNSVMVKEWKTDLSVLQVVHDPFMNCLFVHNPTQEEMYVLWFSTGKTTKVADANFALTAQGSWPIEASGIVSSTNSLSRRAFFLLNWQDTRASGTGNSSWTGPQVYTVDCYQSREIQFATAAYQYSRRITTLDFDGDSRFVATGSWDNIGKRIPFSAVNTIVTAGAWRFSYAYLVWSTNAAMTPYIGRKFKIMYNNTNDVIVDNAGANSWVNNTTAGDVFVVSPVVFEWAGHPLGMETEQGMTFSNADFFRMKVVGSIGASFSDVSGGAKSDGLTSIPLDRFTGLLYSGVAGTPTYTAETYDTARALYSSVEADEGVVYAAFGTDSSDGRYGAKGTTLTPGIRILCPDLDFRLMGCIVRGAITSVERSTQIRGS